MARVHFSNVQGNILKGFNKPNVRLVFFQFQNTTTAKEWLKRIADRIPSTAQLIEASSEFKRRRKKDFTFRPQETWLHVSLSPNGVRKLKKKLPVSHRNPFNFGMKSRSKVLGDIGQSSPRNWIEPFKSIKVDGVLIIASDQEDDADASVLNLLVEATGMGVVAVGVHKGQSLKNEQGKNVEHFGFRDGISQPLIAGIDDEKTSDKKDLFKPEEFVLSGLGKEWANEGSFLVFRRLRQDVNGFWQYVRRECANLGLSPEALAAKFVGRWDSGAPLAKYPDNDPNGLSESEDNDFEYMQDDPRGIKTPRFAHVRKTYPRDDGLGDPEDNDVDNDKHRILRRGIPYGTPIGEKDNEDDEKLNDRGLLFMCYQKDITMQFEFVQIQFANNPRFPKPGNGIQHGHDPIIGVPKHGKAFVNLVTPGKTKLINGLEQWVMTTGGEYFFSPSISAIRSL